MQLSLLPKSTGNLLFKFVEKADYKNGLLESEDKMAIFFLTNAEEFNIKLWRKITDQIGRIFWDPNQSKIDIIWDIFWQEIC